MSKYFKNVKSYEDLKKQFRDLLKANHPDNGGDAEKCKEINVEFDALFAIWKNKKGSSAPENETAETVRSEFYTMNGWEGSNHSWKRSLKEVAQIVRAYVKEKYPTYKFSVRTSYASMCQELHVELKESPIAIYKTAEELDDDDKNEFFRKANKNNLWILGSWSREEFNAEYNRICDENGDFFRVMNEVTKSVVADVDAFVNSYNYSDCDGMIDYFNVDFYYFGCCRNNGQNVKIVPKTARIKNRATAPEKKESAKQESETETAAEKLPGGYTYKITRGEDTRDGSDLWIVRIKETLDRAAYIAENKAMKKRGGYYSKFKKGFVFRFNPAAALGIE